MYGISYHKLKSFHVGKYNIHGSYRDDLKTSRLVFQCDKILFPSESNIAMENQPIWWYYQGNGYCSLPNRSVSCRSAFCWTGRGPKLLVSFLGGVDPLVMGCEKTGGWTLRTWTEVSPEKKGPFQKERCFFGKARLPSPSFFSGPIDFSFSFVFLKGLQKNRQETRIPKETNIRISTLPCQRPSGFLLVKLARVKRLKFRGLGLITSWGGLKFVKKITNTFTLPPLIMVRWKMAVWWKVTTSY